MMQLRIILLTAVTILTCSISRAGSFVPDSVCVRFDAYAKWCSPEKVYVHIDRTCFTAGESIWFKAWIADASGLSVLPFSNFVYAEVLDATGTAVCRVKIKRNGDGFPGCLDIPESLTTGDYTFRAYTLWQMNGDYEYMFNQAIRIVSGTPKQTESPESDAALPNRIDVSFWPESGRYYAGHKSVMAFKVMDSNGRSIDDFQGHLIQKDGKVLMPVSVRHDGMGFFEFLPVSGVSYYVTDTAGGRYPLPEPSVDGACVNLRYIKNYYYMSVMGFGGGKAQLLVRDISEIRPLAEFELTGHMMTVKAEKDYFRPGINHLLIVSDEGAILSERLFFVPVSSTPQVSFDPSRFAIRIENPDGTPLDGTCSVSVVRGALKNWQQEDGIESYMRLSSELKGHINNPYYYFDSSVPVQERSSALDLLMMVQGWRYYDLEKILKTGPVKFQLKYLKEIFQSVRGRIVRRNSSKMPKKFKFTLMIPKLNSYTSLDVGQGDTFLIDSLDFEENTEFLIDIRTNRLGVNNLPKWDGDLLASPYLYKPAPGFGKDARAPLLANSFSDTLQAAVLVADSGDRPDILIFGNNFSSDIDNYPSLTLIEYIGMKKTDFVYNGENMMNRSGARNEGENEETESGVVKLIVDGAEQAWWGYDMLHMEDISSISISTLPDPVYGGEGGVVAISLKPDIQSARERDPSLLYFVPLGHQTPRHFYSPRYDHDEISVSDKRNTVWWSPSVSITGGHASIPFFNTDSSAFPLTVRIEGITASGIPFSHHCEINS